MIPLLSSKDPDDVAAYNADFNLWLNPSEVITDATATITGPDNALTCTEAINFQNVITTFVSGGTLGETYVLHFEITTSLRDVKKVSGQIPVIPK